MAPVKCLDFESPARALEHLPRAVRLKLSLAGLMSTSQRGKHCPADHLELSGRRFDEGFDARRLARRRRAPPVAPVLDEQSAPMLLCTTKRQAR